MPDPVAPIASQLPHRRGFDDPTDPRLENPLGRLRARGQISEAEYQAGCRWRSIYHRWLMSIGAPNPFPAAIDFCGSSGRQDPLDDGMTDEQAEEIAKVFRVGERALKKLGPRVFHAVNAIAVYEEPEELGNYECTAKAAKLGLGALAECY